MRKSVLIMPFLFLISCMKVVDLGVEEIPKQLVINCFFTEKEPFLVHVSRLAPYPDLSSRIIRNARVILFSGEKQLGILSLKDSAYINSSLIPEKGKLYHLQVEAPGFPLVSAEDSLPGKPLINNVSLQKNAGMYQDGIPFHQFSIFLTDNNYVDYYAIQIYIRSIYPGERSYYPMEIFSTDPAIVAEGITGEEFRNYFVFNDKLMQNKTYSIKINHGDYYDYTEVRVILEAGTVHFYNYRKRLLKHDSYSGQDPFKPYEPVPLYTNIKNGQGIFAGYNRIVYEFSVDK